MKVFIVDDSIVYRNGVTRALETESDLEVVGTAANGEIALKKLSEISVDLVIVDMEMPVMGGLSFIKEFRKTNKTTSILTFSSLTQTGASITMEALLAGANDFIPKSFESGPTMGSVEALRNHLLPRVRAFQQRRSGASLISDEEKRVGRKKPKKKLFRFPPKIVCIGSSTGGPEALTRFCRNMPSGFMIPIVIVQHMPPIFTDQLAQTLNKIAPFKVKEAQDKEPIEKGICYIAPGDYHMTIGGTDLNPTVSLNKGERVNFVRPSVDILFSSVAKVFKERSLAIILTGMGEDGCSGCRDLKKYEVPILIQDEITSTVWGMPGAVYRAGLYDGILPVEDIATMFSEIREVA